MDFDLTEEQRLLKDSVDGLLTDAYEFEQRKKYMKEKGGWSKAIWGKLAEQGLLGLPFAEADGGFGAGAVETAIVMEALGKALGVKVEFVQTAWPAMAKDFEADKFDIVMGGVSITLDRQKKGFFSTATMREGKTPISRCSDKGKYDTLAEIDKAGTHVIVNPGGTNERFAKANIHNAEIRVYNDNVTIFDQIAKGDADLMMTDASETRYQQKLHPGVLCAVHPEKPFDFAEKAYWLQRDVALKDFVDQWLHIAHEDGSWQKIYATWFE